MSQYLQGIQLIQNAINSKGINPNRLMDLLNQTVAYYYENEPKNREYCLGVTSKIKDASLMALIKTANQEYEDVYWSTMLFEAQNRVVDSYLLYIERKRQPKDKFYEPKRKQFLRIGLIQALQDIIDDKLNFLSISLPPGTGKALSNSSKVLTPNGFVRNDSLKVGDKVISGRGTVSTILGVYPQGKKPIYEITLENGAKSKCSADHLWNVRRYYFQNKFKEETITLAELIQKQDKCLLPVTNENWNDDFKVFWLKIKSIELVGEEECQCIYIDDVTHLYITDDYIITHNTTIEKFLVTGIMGWYPDDYNLFFSHSSDITRMFYDGVLDIISDSVEYCWGEVFPLLNIQGTNAKKEQINVGKFKAFPSLQCTSVGSKNSGKVRANNFLLCDDLIGGIEEALNKSRLDNLWNVYAVDARQRKVSKTKVDANGNKIEVPCKEIMIATRWSVNDCIGRMQRLFEHDKRARFIAIPDIDPKTGKSNFDFDYNGFSVEFFNEQAMVMDDISYRCLYKNEPIEREGLLYHEKDLRTYSSLPIREPDAIWGICDTKQKGTDFLVMPILYQYGEDYYCVDAICNDSSDYDFQYGKLTEKILEHNIEEVEFESNAGGDRVAHEVSSRVVSLGGRCNITTKPTETNKETRIIMSAEWVKKHIIFKEKDLYTPKEDYGVMMTWLLRYSLVGKNEHDDVPDVFANFYRKVTTVRRIATIEIGDRLW